ncbi:MAG: hypothetical protein IPM00_07020 [Tetrasphaera sp.]|jgi:hypothetical protein|nr:hypothetical protein [Tetrasphaera sp.]
MVTLTTNIGLDDDATGLQTSSVGEPSVAASTSTVFMTGNWYASRSSDRGATWGVIDPFTEFPTDRGRFCCDQLVIYLPRQRLWAWLLQYEQQGTSNIFRLAVSRTGASGSWRWWDIAPTDLNPSWTDAWFDYPDMAVSQGHLWVSFNQYDSNDTWRRAGIVRWPLAELASARPVTRRHWVTTSLGSLRLVQGAGTSMWFAGNIAASRSLHLFQWPDASDAVTKWQVKVGPWNDTDYTSSTPGGGQWLSRLDDRITGGWRAGGQLGFLWSAGRATGRPHPYVRAVTISEQTLKVTAEPDLWSQNGAWAYPAAAANKAGTVGLTAFYGGPDHPAHAVGVLDATSNTWATKLTATSTHSPLQGKWGDYVVCRAHPSRRTSWIASGYTLQGGQDRRNIEPRYVVFRR